MTTRAIKTQVTTIKKATTKAAQSKRSALAYLTKAGLVAAKSKKKK